MLVSVLSVLVVVSGYSDADDETSPSLADMTPPFVVHAPGE
jgi:hypothetical protein